MKKTSKLKIILFVFLLGILWNNNGESQDTTILKEFFPANINKRWLKISSPLYKVILKGNGTLHVKSNFFAFEVSLIEIWKKYQFFPYVKGVIATVKRDNEDTLSVNFEYWWNEGKVKEAVIFYPSRIYIKYIYSPWIEKKNTGNFLCLFRFKKPKILPDFISFTGIDRDPKLDGKLHVFHQWKNMKGLINFSIRNKKGEGIEFLAEGNAWLRIWKWPRMILQDNGNYPRWTKVVYSKGENKILSCTIEFLSLNKGIGTQNIKLKELQ